MARKQTLHALDQEINTLQSNLFDLYRKRQDLFGEATDFPGTLRATTVTTEVSADDTYESLKELWAARDVTIPDRKKLLPTIKSALITAAQLADALGVDQELFIVELIPPQRSYSDAELAQDRLIAPHVSYADKVDAKCSKRSATKWKVLVIYDGIDGLLMGSAAEIIEERLFFIGGHDSRALGVAEYQIYALRHQTARDQQSWTWLLKDSHASAVSVTFTGGAYRFVSDDANGLLGIGHREVFRPAVEIDV